MRSISTVSSLAAKVLMALPGLFLLLFLFIHLSINLLLLLPDGGQAFSTAAAFMGANPFIKVAEVILLSSFALHSVIALLLSRQSRAARPVAYVIANRSDAAPFSRYMLHSGIIILLFLLWHSVDFYLIKLGIVLPPAGIDPHDFYQRALLLFANAGVSLFYVLSFIALGVHVNHAMQSALQTLGINHSRYFHGVKLVSSFVALLLSTGFSIVPIALYFFRS